MNDVWNGMFKDWIECYSSIECLVINGIINQDKALELASHLLAKIIETVRSEVEL